MDQDEAQKKIREAAEAGNIEYASQEGVNSFDPAFVDEFLSHVCDVDCAWISDESSLLDFVGTNGHEEACARIEKKYWVDVRKMLYLLDIFRAIHATNRTAQ